MVQRTVNLGSFAPGVNNRLEPTALGKRLPDRTQGTYLYAADNIDLNGSGKIKRRRGFANVLSYTGAHSLWSAGDYGYVIDGDRLIHLKGAATALVATVIATGLTPHLPATFTRAHGGRVYWSNGDDIGCVIGQQVVPLVTPMPTVPAVVQTTGALLKGRYQITFTAMSADGGESASTMPEVLDLPENSGIELIGLGADMRVYMTGPDGVVFNQVSTDGQILSLSNDGAPCATLLMHEMPAGQIVRMYNAHLLVARGSLLLISEPYYHGLYNPSRNYIEFPAPITVVEPCENGVYVCADQTYWLAGNLLDTDLDMKLPYGGLPGSGVSFIEKTGQCFWQSPEGIVVGAPNGAVTVPQAEQLTFGPASAGATLFRERDGAQHIVAARQDAQLATTAAANFLRYETTRKETSL